MLKTKISAVSYTNSYPFVYGLQHHIISKHIELSLDNPAVCAKKLVNNEVDIGLIPVIALEELNYYNILSGYCIGAVNNVQTVVLASNNELQEIKEVFLDNQSRSSNMLCRVLEKNYWRKGLEFQYNNEITLPVLKENQGCIIIGDRVFETRSNYKYRYDLSKEWFEFTRLPFVFAVWAANKQLNPQFIEQFEQAVYFGMQNMDKAIEVLAEPDKKDILKDYYTRNISYIFDNEKKKGMKLFLEYAKKL